MEPTVLEGSQLMQLGVLPHTPEKAALIQSYEQGSEEWQRERQLRLGASEVGAVGTRGAPQERDDLLASRRHGPAAPSAAMQRGKRLEPQMAQRFVEKMKVGASSGGWGHSPGRVGAASRGASAHCLPAVSVRTLHACLCLLQESGQAIELQRGSLLIHPRLPWLSATPDYFYVAAGGAVTLLELKGALGAAAGRHGDRCPSHPLLVLRVPLTTG